jgi:DNA-directed RNA polymerase specialized sigma24 family protein
MAGRVRINDDLGPIRTSMVFDRSIGPAEPATCRTTAACTNDCTSLRWLIADPVTTASNAQPHDKIEAILLHPDLKSKVERAANKVSAMGCASVSPEDVAQQAELRLLERLTKRPLTYEDRGELQFHTWIGKVVTRAVLKAKDDCTAKVATVLVGDMSRFQVAVTNSEDADSIEELRAAIAKIPYVDMRHAIDDEFAGLTIEESAQRRGISPSHVGDLRGKGKQWLRSFFSRD